MQFHFPAIKLFPALLFTFANLLLPWEFRPTHDALYGYINWGKIEFDWTSKPVPTATVQVRGRDDSVKLQYEFASTAAVSDSPADDAMACKPPRELPSWERAVWQLTFAGTIGLFVLSIVASLVVALWLVWYYVSTLTALVVRSVLNALEKEKDE